MTFKAWLIIGAELLLSFLVIYLLLGQIKDEKKRVDDAKQRPSLANATIKDMQTRQRDVAALDSKYTGDLKDAKPLLLSLNVMLLLVSGGCKSTQDVPRTDRPAPAA